MAKLCTAWVDGYTLTWTATAVSDNNAPDTDTAVAIGPHVHHVYCEWDTNPVDTGAPTVDIHIEVSFDGTNYTTTHYATLCSAVLKDLRGGCMLTPPNGAVFLKARADINVANIAAAEYFTLKIKPVME